VERPTIIRNVAIFVAGTLAISVAGGAIIAWGSMAGALLLVLGPAIMASLLRLLAGDGWRDAGLGLNLAAGWPWYLFALLAYPLTFVAVLLIGAIFGLTRVNVGLGELIQLALAGMVVQLVPRMLAAFGEEWGWRGYMEPRLAAAGVPDLPRHMIVGLVWAAWHFPLILTTPYTKLPMTLFAPLFILGTIVAAVVYGQLRKMSGTVWAAVLMHGAANTVAFALIADGVTLGFSNKAIVFFGPESVVVMVIWSLLAFWFFRRGGRPPSTKGAPASTG
jgi:membrane protease YdiL (CAAX protease family)